jgi:DHA3 family macrolide efflux protein-like MFS transporter
MYNNVNFIFNILKLLDNFSNKEYTMATQFSVNDGRTWKARFFSIWTGQAFSLLGSELVSFALVWYLTVETESATVLAISSLVVMLPRIILGPIFGSLVDRWNRRLVMLFSDAFIALATIGLAVLFASEIVEIWHIYTLMFVRSVAGSLHGMAMGASTSLMVPVEHFTRIQGFNQFLNGGLGIIAAPLGAVLLDVLPMQGILAIDVVTAVIAIVPLLFFDVPQPDRVEKQAGEKDSIWEDMKDGFAYLRKRNGLMAIIGMAMVINLVLTPASSLMALLVRGHFNGEAIQFGLFNSSFSFGIIGGSLLLGVWGGFKNKAVTSMVGVLGIGIGFIALGLLPPTAFYIALGFGVVTGLTLPLANGGIGAIMQSSITPEMQGRVMGLLNAGASAMSPIGLLLAGPMADTFGIQFPYMLSGIVTLVMGVAGFLIPAVMNIEEEGKVYISSAVEPASAD